VTYTPGSTPTKPLRTDTITAEYEGDSTHQGSKGTTVVTVVSPTALAHGSFTIGDKNATIGNVVTFSDVEWWGSNWWKANALSGGPAPSAFKGFAESSPSPPQCGETWTTNTGNSSGPPATVPEYMEVIGASKITQSGSTISGNAPKLAVVKTNPGYLPSPGHKGTGKVVAVGACVVGGSLRDVKIRKLDEKTTRPDAVYTTDYLEAGGQRYVEHDVETFGLRFAPVKDLLAFAKARQKTKKDDK